MLETLSDTTPEGVKGWENWRQGFVSMKGELARHWREALEDLSLDQLVEQVRVLDEQETAMLCDDRYDDDDGMDHRARHNISMGRSIAAEFTRRIQNVAQITDVKEASASFWEAYENAANAGKDPFAVPYVQALSTRGQLLTELSGIHHH